MLRCFTPKDSKLQAMKYLSVTLEVLLILGFSILGLGLVYCQQQFNWNSGFVYIGLVAFGVWVWSIHLEAAKAFRQSVEDWG